MAADFPKILARLGLVSSIAAAGLAGGSVAARGETLNRALVSAYKGNPRIRGARATLRAIDEEAAQAISRWRPTISAEGSAGQISTETRSGPRVGSDTTRTSVGLRLSQNIFRGGRNFYQWRQAHNNIRAQRHRLSNTEQQVFLDVVRAYMNVLRETAVLRLRFNNERVLARQLQATRDRFNVGEVTRTDVAQAQARLSQARADRIQAQGDLESTRANYRNVVGHWPGKLVSPRLTAFVPKTRSKLVALSRKYNPTILAAYYDELSARESVNLVRGELRPTVSLNASIERNWDALRGRSDTRSDSASIVGTLTIPLYQSGSVFSRLRAAKQTVYVRRNDLVQANRTTVETAVRAWTALVTARSQVVAFRSAVRANTIALNGVQQEARTGSRTVLDVLDAQQELLNSQVSLTRAQRDRIVSAYEVLAAMGRLTARDLKLPVKEYRVKSYYMRVRFKPFGSGRRLAPKPQRPDR